MSSSITVGDYEISIIDDHIGTTRKPLQVYPDVPESAWDPYRSFALDETGSWNAQWRGHLIRRTDGAGPKILIDTGMGIGPHEHTGRNGELLDNLAAAGLAPGDIDIVVTTHCHGDHIGWNISDGKPTFLNATYRIAKNDWDFYSQADNVNPQFDASIRPLKAAGNLELVDGVVELARGITTYPTHGHTPGHQCVLVESGGETAVVTGDLFHNVAQVTEQTWCPTFDWNTDKSTASRKGLLARAQSENWTVCSGHLASGKSMGKVVDESGKSVWHAI